MNPRRIENALHVCLRLLEIAWDCLRLLQFLLSLPPHPANLAADKCWSTHVRKLQHCVLASVRSYPNDWTPKCEVRKQVAWPEIIAPLADTMPGRLRISAQKLQHPVWNSNRRVVDSTLKVCVEESLWRKYAASECEKLQTFIWFPIIRCKIHGWARKCPGIAWLDLVKIKHAKESIMPRHPKIQDSATLQWAAKENAIPYLFADVLKMHGCASWG